MICLSVRDLFAAEVVVSPPYVFIPVAKSQLRPEIQVAAQNCWVKKGGAYTGEVRLVLDFLWPFSYLCICLHSFLYTNYNSVLSLGSEMTSFHSVLLIFITISFVKHFACITLFSCLLASLAEFLIFC
jgi:hypothetical protein